ncbi:nicotinate (nicotinamide) nucleotide adenylyltransferase [Sediminispirochaeta smaragdinae]|uniref:Probable nicotinate-nucleotide adenylyltransferase n=1 Tax=Sediminispirochaeta smaragdinae (strain DSM 11293 / JCM 15392 / SEBR 4228) TaxID=573413 RepID=E1R6B4_SEDSS|nr:nicotinate (nicotinamide) nucleotide adenylyltransferase [Sediminispirochaeta smaragdinae]ADK80932.1 nicotinate (nicotinamide) nucleotide adenylyltransferase [Sediminispirochaeta smaragdinae DSM 11293]
MRIALFGGSFNPIHVGHLHLADELRTDGGYDQVVFIPSFVSPHKSPDDLIDPQLRLEMVRKAAEPAGFIVDDCEIKRKGVSYTADTVDYIYRTYAFEGKPALVVGDDLLDGLNGWKRWNHLSSMVDVVVARREQDTLPLCSELSVAIENLLLPISSSDIRKRVRDGKAYRFLVPEIVYHMIEDLGLYR